MNQAESLVLFEAISKEYHKQKLRALASNLSLLVVTLQPPDVIFNDKEPISEEVVVIRLMQPVTEDMILYAMAKLEDDLKTYSHQDPMYKEISQKLDMIDELVCCRTALRKLGEVFE